MGGTPLSVRIFRTNRRRGDFFKRETVGPDKQRFDFGREIRFVARRTNVFGRGRFTRPSLVERKFDDRVYFENTTVCFVFVYSYVVISLVLGEKSFGKYVRFIHFRRVYKNRIVTVGYSTKTLTIHDGFVKIVERYGPSVDLYTGDTVRE